MAFKKADITKMAAILKIKETDFIAAAEAKEEVDIVIADDLETMTKTELTTLKANEYKSGKTAGVEMTVKEVKEKHELEFTGKTIDGLLEAYGKKVIADAGIEPTKKVTELEGKIKTLQTTVTEQEKKIAEKDTEVEKISTKSELYKHIPLPAEDGPALSQDNIVSLMVAEGYEFKREGGVLIPYKDGKQLQDKLSNAREVKDVISDFLTEKKFVKGEAETPTGRGAGDKKPGPKAGKLSELKKQFQADGKSMLGEEFKAAVDKAVADNKEFDMNS
jgi:hypothetical protein